MEIFDEDKDEDKFDKIDIAVPNMRLPV